MQKKSFEEIRELVIKKYEPLDRVPYDYLNEKGKFILDVYEELYDGFSMADNLEEYVEWVRFRIENLLKPMWSWSPETIENNKKVAEKLRRFVRVNVSKELWENIPEFANRKEN